MKWHKENDEVFYPQEGKELVLVDEVDLVSLKHFASLNQRNLARFCAHKNISDPVHEMFIFHKKGHYVRPHKHLSKAESFHLIEGEADILIFDEQGNVRKVLNLGSYASGKCFFYRIPESCYHTQIFKQDTIFHEVSKGPFEKSKTVFPDWTPEESELNLVSSYMEKLYSQIKAYDKRHA